MIKNFALIGAAGFIAPRHLKAIYDTGSKLVAACDPHDSVGILDSYGFDVKYFREIERFDRHLSKLHRVDYVSVCTPNYLHDAHCRLAMRVGADVVCEKPLVINPWNLDALQEIEQETGRRIYTVLQLRKNPKLIELKEKITTGGHRVMVTYVTPRGNWYWHSWKGDEEKSGGIEMNIGVHLFDLLIWLFGPVDRILMDSCRTKEEIRGYFWMEKAEVSWFLSTNPFEVPTRKMCIDDSVIDFNDGFTNLHTAVYEDILAGGGFGILDAKPSIELVHKIKGEL